MRKQSGSSLIIAVAGMLAISTAAIMLAKQQAAATDSFVQQYSGTQSFLATTSAVSYVMMELGRTCTESGPTGLNPSELSEVNVAGPKCKETFTKIVEMNGFPVAVDIYNSDCKGYGLSASGVRDQRRRVVIQALSCVIPEAEYSEEFIETLPNKVTICHKMKEEISVSKNALKAHLAHGDMIDHCSNLTPRVTGVWGEDNDGK